jgi:hypothetical protein
MTLVKDYIPEEKPSKVTKEGVQVISLMSTSRILWFVATRHRLGLWALTATVSLSYTAYDKFLHIFF